MSGAALLAVLGGGAWTQRSIVLENWYLYRWRHAQGDEKEAYLQSLLDVGSVRALNCLENEGTLYLIDVGGRARFHRSGARALAEVRRHIQALSDEKRFAIAWIGRGVSIFPPLKPGTARPQLAKAEQGSKEKALAFLEAEWAAEAPREDPCIRWALLTALTLASDQGVQGMAICYFGSGPESVDCRYCEGHSLSDVMPFLKSSTKVNFHCFAVRPPPFSRQEEFLKGLAATTGGRYVLLKD